MDARLGWLLAALLAGCATTAPPPKSVSPSTPPGDRDVTPVVVDQTPGWTTTDEAALAESFAVQCLRAAEWAGQFAAEQARKPALRVAAIVNRTSSPALTEVMLGAIERILLSERLPVLVGRGAASWAAQAEQDLVLSGLAEEGPRVGEERAADFVVTVTLQEDSVAADGGRWQSFRGVLKVVNAETGELACAAQGESRRMVR